MEAKPADREALLRAKAFLRANAAEKRDHAKEVADAQFLEDIRLIELTMSLADTTLPIPSVPALIATPLTPPKRVGGRKNGPTAAIRRELVKIGSGFTAMGLREHFQKKPDLKVSSENIYSSLNKMTTGGEIEQLSDGTYRIIELKKIGIETAAPDGGGIG